MGDEGLLRAQDLERSVVRKVLLGLTPFLALLYVFNLLDRGNISIAALTMQKDLKFSDSIYGLGAGMFFIGYFFFEVPSNLIMERVGARRWIARIMLSWGVVSASMALVHSPATFYTMRFLLGVAEAGFYPGIVLYLTYWVPENVRARVIARFLALTTVLGLFGGPLGGLLLKVKVYHMTGWQWLFILEGIPSILLGCVVFRLLPNSPSEVGWLTQEEKNWLAMRLAQEAKNEQRVQHMSIRVALSEPRVIHLCAIFIITATAGNAVGFFGPQLLKSRSGGMWSDSFVATIGIIPGIMGAIAMLVAAVHSDRTSKRRQHIAFGYFLAGLGFLACVFAPNANWTLAALAVNALGERTAAGSYWAMTTNLLGARAAAGGIAFINSVGNLGGFFGPTLMGELKQRTRGGYAAGLYTAACLMFIGALLGYLLRRQPVFTPMAMPETPEEAIVAPGANV